LHHTHTPHPHVPYSVPASSACLGGSGDAAVVAVYGILSERTSGGGGAGPACNTVARSATVARTAGRASWCAAHASSALRAAPSHILTHSRARYWLTSAGKLARQARLRPRTAAQTLSKIYQGHRITAMPTDCVPRPVPLETCECLAQAAGRRQRGVAPGCHRRQRSDRRLEAAVTIEVVAAVVQRGVYSCARRFLEQPLPAGPPWPPRRVSSLSATLHYATHRSSHDLGGAPTVSDMSSSSLSDGTSAAAAAMVGARGRGPSPCGRGPHAQWGPPPSPSSAEVSRQNTQ